MPASQILRRLSQLWRTGYAAADARTDLGLGTAATTAATAYATAGQGALAASAVQPGDLAAYAPKASPAFTGTPTAPTQTPGNNSTRLATTAYADAAIAALINSAPGVLDTLAEIATALGNDPNFAATMAAALAAKASKSANLSDLADAATARNNLGLGTAATTNANAYAPASHNHTLSQITDFLTWIAAWVGSTAITTLGTIATGVWQGSKIAVAYLGTGTPSAGKYLDGGGSWTTLPASGGASLPSTTALIKGDGAGGASSATAGTDYSVPGNAETFAGAKTFTSKVTQVGMAGTSSMETTTSGNVVTTYNGINTSGSASWTYAVNASVKAVLTANGTRSSWQFGPEGFLCWGSTAPNAVGADTNLGRAAAAVVSVTGGANSNLPGGLSTIANSPASLASNTNNYSPGVGIFQRWSASAPVSITGMVAGQAGEWRHVANVGSSAITLTNQDASSTAGNRWITSAGANVTLGPNQIAFAIYDATTAAWRVSILP